MIISWGCHCFKGDCSSPCPFCCNAEHWHDSAKPAQCLFRGVPDCQRNGLGLQELGVSFPKSREPDGKGNEMETGCISRLIGINDFFQSTPCIVPGKHLSVDFRGL